MTPKIELSGLRSEAIFEPAVKVATQPDTPYESLRMIRYACIAAALTLGIVAPLAAQNASRTYDFQERTRTLAFDPARFFPEGFELAMSVRYLGDDYGYPVYAVAVHKGCTADDRGEARRTCGERLTARMVRSPYEGKPPRPRARGQRLFAMIAQSKPQSDDALLPLLDKAGLEWREADIRKCPTAMAHLRSGQDLRFSAVLGEAAQAPQIVLHADKVSFEIGGYLTRSRYEGWLKPGSPGEWADDFVASLEPCWTPSMALVPWRVIKG